MFPNGGPSWSGYPPQNPGYPYYYPSAYYPPYNNATSVPPPNPSAPGPSSSPATTPTTRLTTNAREFVPARTADSASVTPSPGFPLPKRSSILKISDPRTGERIVPRPLDPGNGAEATGVERPIPPQRPLTKKEKKGLAQDKLRAEARAKERLRKEEEEKKAKKDAEDAETLIRAREEVLKKREEEARKRAEEDLRKKKEEEDRIQREKEENNATSVPPASPYVAGPSSSPVTTPLTANAPELVPTGTTDWTPVTPSAGFPLPRRSSILKIPDPRTGERIVPQPPDPVNGAQAAGVEQQTAPQRPLTKKERKRLAKLEADEKLMADPEARERLRKEEEERKAKKDAEHAEAIRKVREEILKSREETARKKEEFVLNRRKEEARKRAEEELLRKKEEEGRIQREKEEREREEAEAKAKADEEQRLVRLAQEPVAGFWAERQEEASPTGIIAGLGPASTRPPSATPKLPLKWGSVWSTEDPDMVINTEGTQSPSAESDYARTLLSGKYRRPNSRNLRPDPPPVRKERPETVRNLDNVDVEPQDDASTVNIPSSRTTGQVRDRGSYLIHERTSASGMTSEGRFLASQRRLQAIAASQAASSSPQPGVPPSPSYSQGSFIARGRPKDQVASDDATEDGQRQSGRTPAEPADPRALTAISQLSKQMKELLQEVRKLRGEVQEIRSETQSEEKGEPSKVSPERESSAPEVKKTATATQQYFIMKEGELDFSPGDVITILDAPEGTRYGWLYGEVNITKRGFFPGASPDRPLLLVEIP
ncbi:hypothetical protein FRC01_011320 [Tulasnella sp. 417]|nr:hypothetical protein FRC01_011320 [Tulasnella sp. 417]